MRSYLSFLFASSSTRDYAVAGIMLVVLSVVGVKSFANFVDSTRQNVRVETAQIQRSEQPTRNYSIMRSVLDDTVATGSIGGQGQGRPVILDPCTGQVKSK